MSTTGRPHVSDLPRERDGIVESNEDADRLPVYIAGPIIVALSLSLWVGIGFVVYALL
jgi:hypothetical protein